MFIAMMEKHSDLMDQFEGYALKCENTDTSTADEKHTVKKSLKQGDVNKGIERGLNVNKELRGLSHFTFFMA